MFKKLINLMFVFAIFSCQKENKQQIDEEIVKQGEPVGSPIQKEIDENGGFIDIEINNARIIFPKNTVTSKTLISVQPITNTFANYGIGLRISSHYKNIEIQLKYPQNELPPKNFEIYFLKTDSPDFGWYKFKNKTIDTLNHTISIIQDAENQLTKASASAKVATHSFDYVVGK